MSWHGIDGHDEVVEQFRRAIGRGRLASSFLFAGPAGIGKRSFALKLAQAMLCQTRPEEALDPCDACPGCSQVVAGTHPDVMRVAKPEGKAFIPVELFIGDAEHRRREGLCHDISLKPYMGGRKIAIIDDADYLNPEGANALLKTLEEPSPHAVLILLAADASPLPGTILSRCQWVRFGSLPEEFVARKVREALAAKASQPPVRGKKAEPPPAVSAEEIAFVSRFSGGSIEQAARLAGSGLHPLKRQILTQLPEMDAAAALDMAAAIDKWARDQVKEAHVKMESPEGHAVRRWASRLALAAVASAFGDAGVLAATGSAARPINADQPTTLAALAAWPAEATAQAVGILADAQAHIDRYVHTELATENALVQLSRLRPPVARK